MDRIGLGKGLGQGYKNLVPRDSYVHSLSAKGISSRNQHQRALMTQLHAKTRKKMLPEFHVPTVMILSPQEFEDMFADDYTEYEIGYATTKVMPDGRTHIFVKDSGDDERNGKLLMHELRELEIFDELVHEQGVDPHIADEMAHNMNPVKVEGVMDTYQLDATN